MAKPKLTPWFPASVKPVHRGIYAAKFSNIEGYAYWSGSRWTNLFSEIEYCQRGRDFFGGAIQQKQWRGLASNPKATA